MDVLVAPKLAPAPSLTHAVAEQVQAYLLERHKIRADLHANEGVALLSVWTGLVVWFYPGFIRWSTGRSSGKTGRSVYAYAPVDAPAAAAQRIAMRYEELRRAELATTHRVG